MTEPDNNDVWVEVAGDRVKVPNWATLPLGRIDRAELTYRLEVTATSPEAMGLLNAMIGKTIERAADMIRSANHGTVTAYRSESRSVAEHSFFDNEPL